MAVPSDDDGPLMISLENRFYTRNLDPGNRVYGEKLVTFEGKEFREWSPRRSKLSAYYVLNGKECPFSNDSRVLYLGAASGTTASHISDLVPDGIVYCVEFSPRSFRDLVKVCDRRMNMVPLLGDATRPESFAFAVDGADIVYQDVAQKRQAEIFAENMETFSARTGFLCIKARSEDVSASPERIFSASERTLMGRNFRILDKKHLDPYEKDHMMAVAER